MSRLIELRRAIHTFLLSKHPRTYHKHAPGDTAFPYLTYELPNSFDDGEAEAFRLEVDGWDTADDSVALEQLMELVDGDGDLENPSGLHRHTFYVEGVLAAQCYREGRLELDDDQQRTRRRKYAYQVKVF